LNSTQEKEDISDWMSYHQNEKDEWMRYGAAVYLSKSNNAVIRNSKITNGQNAMMMTECDSAMVYNNDFSFNSGIGIAMYRCNDNKVLYNKLAFNVRGYSHGVYNRGQDSAGILVYEQSNRNLFYKNLATHNGDGFFLWAGQTTMDSGTGGCNDNILFENDFSYAPTNGIEVTFSRNQIIHNRIFECDHGIWGGYSFSTVIRDNQFRDNRIGIAIEHGQENRIHHNLFFRDKEAIKLWARKEQPADWGYARNRDTRSRNYILASNSFNKNEIVFNLNRTDSIYIFSNLYNDYATKFKIDSPVGFIDSSENDELVVQLSDEVEIPIPQVAKPNDPFKGSGKRAGRKNIMMTEWGPYNFSYPLLWNTSPTDTSGKMEFDVFGPKGEWRIISVKGLKNLSAKKGNMPARFTADKVESKNTDIKVIAEFIGASYVDQYGIIKVAQKPQRFQFTKFFQPIDFVVSWYSFDSSTNPIKDSLYPDRLKTQRPFKIEHVNRLDYAWWGGIKSGDQQLGQFLTVAEGSAHFQKGEYEMGITWDDAVRVYVDGKLMVNEWNPSRYKFDESPNKKIRLPLNGLHNIRVEHVELGGFATLSLKFRKIK
jgi:parallel beta-helix repeat protein